MRSRISLTVLITAVIVNAVAADPIPLYDHSFRSFNADAHYRLSTPRLSPVWDVHNITLQISNRYYYSDDTSLVNNRWLLHFADSINFQDIDFNFRIRLDGPGYRVRDAGWAGNKVGKANNPGFVYDPDRIVAYYTPNERFRFGFGKDRYNWGPLELGGLLLSDYNQGFTGFYQQYALGPFVLRGLTAQLNSMMLHADRDKVTQRYLSAARLEYGKPSYGFALGQSIVFSGVGRGVDLKYLFPFYIFHYGQMSEMSDGYGNHGQNTAGALDGYVKFPGLPLETYGELMVDDFQGHSDERSRSVQNAVSWMLGLRLKNAGPWYGFIEGGKISTYTYNHIDTTGQVYYKIKDSFIGSPLGPDQQLLWGKFGRTFLNDTLGVDLNFWLRRSGERHGRNKMYPIQSYNNTRHDPQPYGTVEDELSLWAALSYRKFYADMEIRAGATTYRNRNNEISNWKSYPFVGVFLSSGISVGAAR